LDRQQFPQFPPQGARQVVAISQDGTQIAYVAENRLYRRSIGELEVQSIPGVEADVRPRQPVFSPDGHSLAFYSLADGTLKRIPARGGTPVTIAPARTPSGMNWSAEGIVFADASNGIWRVSPNGGTPEQLVRVEGGQQVSRPHMLPGGTAILFTLAQTAGPETWDSAQVVVQSLATGERKTIIERGTDARFLASGHIVYAVSGSLLAVGFDPRTRAVIGVPAPVLVGVRRDDGVGYSTAQFWVSETGSLVYIPGPATTSSNLSELVLADRNGAAVPLKLPAAKYAHPRVSRDGARIAVAIPERDEANIWVYDLAGTSAIRRLTLEGRNAYPVWSADGQRIAFQSDREGDLGIFWQRADGGGAPERLTKPSGGASHMPESWSFDGKYLLFTERKRAASYALFTLSLADKTVTPFGDVQSAEPTSAAFSPNGRWVTYASTAQAGGAADPNRGIFIQPFPATGARYPVPKTRIDFHPAWSADGQEVMYVSAAAQPFVTVTVRTDPSVTFGVPTELPSTVPRPGVVSTDTRGYDVLPDGRILSLSPVVDRDDGGTTLNPEIRVVVNWFEELKRLVPTK
jgi:Tol biopolymer transport system component